MGQDRRDRLTAVFKAIVARASTTDITRRDKMGRGRQKAKNTKVARELKYQTPNTDLSQLERELLSAQQAAEGSEKTWDYDDEDDE
jgi:hypothetical protein